MRKLLAISLFICLAGSIQAQDDYIKIAVAECCDCFSSSKTDNQDSLMIACSIFSIARNFEGLVSDLEISMLKNDQAHQVLMDRMVKHFKKCKPIKKYFKQKYRGQGSKR